MIKHLLFKLFLIYSSLYNVIGGVDNKFTSNENGSGDYNNLNAILFLTRSNSSKFENDNEIPFVNISRVGTIQPCTLRAESSLPLTMEGIIQHQIAKREKCDCKKLLDSSTSSLFGWARNVMGMTTAIVSLNDGQKEDSKDGFSNYYDYKLEIADSPLYKKAKKPLLETIHSTVADASTFRSIEKLPLSTNNNFQYDDLPDVIKDPYASSQYLPVYNSYLQQPQLKFNNIHRFHRNKFKNLANVHRVKRKLIIDPENTEIINIKSVVTREPNEIQDIPALTKLNRPESIWDTLGVMSVIRGSFFDHLFGPVIVKRLLFYLMMASEILPKRRLYNGVKSIRSTSNTRKRTLKDPQQRMVEEETGLKIKSLGQIQAPSLFNLVKNTLQRLQRQTSVNKGSGYLLVVLGGSLSQVSDPYSDVIQSVKHVRETTNPDRTLLVVTSNCPDITNNANLREIREPSLPVYAIGPNYKMLSNAKELFDVPAEIRNALKDNKTGSHSKVDKKENKNAKTPTANLPNDQASKTNT